MAEPTLPPGPLAAVGLTALEEHTYRTLVSLRAVPIGELRDLLGMSAETVDRVVASLAAKRLVTATSTTPRRLIATPVEVASETLLLARFKELQAARAEFGRLTEQYRAAGNRTSVDELIEIVPAEAIPGLFEQLQHQATREVWMVTMPPYSIPADANDTEMERLAAGVTYRALYARSALDEPGGIATMRRYIAAGEQARVLPTAALKVAIFDRKIALVPIAQGRPPAVPRDNLIVHECSLLDALIDLFERLWLSAVPFDPVGSRGAVERDGANRTGLSSAESQLLTMLLAGMTDDAIGRQLGLARRSVVRRVHGLMNRAKANNRLQLVLCAMQLGWIELATPPGRDRPTPAELVQDYSTAQL